MRNLPRLLSLLVLALSACTIEFIDQDDDDDDPLPLDGGFFWPDAQVLDSVTTLDGGGEICGNGIVDTVSGEQCDDGNLDNGDGCSSTCQLPAATCGNGTVDAGEQCDNGQPGVNTATCDRDCTVAACGDALVNFPAGEQCDTGTVSTSCDPDCTAVVCGDGLVNPTANEQCDDGNFVDTDSCRNNCTLP